MNASVITIGDEILIGQIVDTNTAFISQRLNDIGIRVRRKLSIGDSAGEITSMLETESLLSDVVVITGGLGPTKDDITKKTLAEYFGSTLIRHQGMYDAIEERCRRRGFDFNELNRAQALVPDNCTVLMNHNGTAPGMWFETEGKIIVSLPGVPFEMEALMDQQVIPMLSKLSGAPHIHHGTALVYGIGESALALKIADWEDALPGNIKLAYLPGPYGIRLRLSIYGQAKEEAVETADKLFRSLGEIIPENFVGYGDKPLYRFIAEELTAARSTLAIAESCTGGHISSLFTSLPGASKFLTGAVVAYDNSVKKDILGVPAGLLEDFGAVSRETALYMADGVRRLMRTDYGVATTGIAGPDGGTKEKPVGTVWVAVCGPHGAMAEKHSFGYNIRKLNIERASAAAMDLLRRQLKESSF